MGFLTEKQAQAPALGGLNLTTGGLFGACLLSDMVALVQADPHCSSRGKGAQGQREDGDTSE